MTPPYASDTRAKGWRFEIDTEAVKASDTWLRARTGAVKGALLLLWSEAWQQTPCGSLPDDDELVALLIDMPTPAFAKNRAVLMRGWARADDGRLYHDTITKRVMAMLVKRAKDAKRTADRRERQADAPVTPPEDTPESRVTGAGQACDSPVSSPPSTKHQAPTKEKPPSAVRATKASKRCPPDFQPEGWEEMQAQCLGVSIARETEKFRDWEFKRATSDWQAAWRRWMRKAFDDLPKGAPVLSFKERDSAAAAARVREMTGGLMDVSRNPLDTIEMETPRAAQIGNR